MRITRASILTPLLFFILTPAFAIEAPRIVPRMQEIQKPADEVYAALKRYFTDARLSRFQLVSEDKRTRTLVAKESGVDGENWTKWAYCQTGAVQMIYKLEDGTVTVKVKLDKSTRHSTFASVTADFQGTYGLGANQNKVDCTSKFVLEDAILAAGAPPAK
ncbi:MAG TPA: hypothetical protein VE243_05465 [Candidatus Acidoferrum sp.]|nr:hypothetical protein [Candidatus Acidoferrum sp.]